MRAELPALLVLRSPPLLHSSTHWGGPGFPIFVWVGGEGTESCTRLTGGLNMVTAAVKHQALLLNVEHRFYGDSYPTSDSSTANLQFLSSEQALADLARIISHDERRRRKTTLVEVALGVAAAPLRSWKRAQP